MFFEAALDGVFNNVFEIALDGVLGDTLDGAFDCVLAAFLLFALHLFISLLLDEAVIAMMTVNIF